MINFKRTSSLSRLLVNRFCSTKGNDNHSGNENPITRTTRILSEDVRKGISKLKSSIGIKNEPQTTQAVYKDDVFPTHCDVLVIGGGGIGSSTAFWLKQRAGEGLNVVVVEKDPTYSKASTSLSVGGLRQQFSLPENIQMSLYGAEFIRNIHEHLGEDIDVNFTPHGYLMLATQQGAEQLRLNCSVQKDLGAKNELLGPAGLKKKFPWISTEGIELGCLGLENEGWFDPWTLLYGLKRRAVQLGTEYVCGEVVGFEFKKQDDILMDGVEPGTYEGLEKAVVKLENGETKTIKFALCVMAAGAQSGAIAKLARIGTGKGILSMPLPVEPRKRYVYSFDCQSNNPPGLNTPLTIDPNNTYFRREGLGGRYIAGRSPPPELEPSVDNLEVDHDYFDEHVWPMLVKRAPCFEAIKVRGSWAGYYEYNTFDANGIIGPHPYYNNLYIATGFSGHGIQQVPAVGRAISEMILDGEFQTIDLTRLGFDRIILNTPMKESNIV